MTITLMIDGTAYEGWKTARVTRGIDRAVSDFDLTVSQNTASAQLPAIRAGASCRIDVDGQPIITGWVDEIAPSYDASTHEISIRGRSKTCDLVDCSAVNKPGQWRGITLLEIARAIAKPFNIEVRVAGGEQTQRVADFQIQQGETAYAAIERLCRLQGFLASDDENGNLILARVGSDRSAGTIQCIPFGTTNNATQGSATFSVKERFSHYIVKGQSAGSDTVDGEAARGAKFELQDSNVTRYRPLVVVAEGQSNTATARERAAWERATRAANSIQLNYTVPGWASGPAAALWRPNTLVPVQDVLLGVAGDFLIAEVSYQISDSGGSLTTMRLAPPDAFKPEPQEKDTKKKAKASESVDAWGDTE